MKTKTGTQQVQSSELNCSGYNTTLNLRASEIDINFTVWMID